MRQTWRFVLLLHLIFTKTNSTRNRTRDDRKTSFSIQDENHFTVLYLFSDINFSLFCTGQFSLFSIVQFPNLRCTSSTSSTTYGTCITRSKSWYFKNQNRWRNDFPALSAAAEVDQRMGTARQDLVEILIINIFYKQWLKLYVKVNLSQPTSTSRGLLYCVDQHLRWHRFHKHNIYSQSWVRKLLGMFVIEYLPEVPEHLHSKLNRIVRLHNLQDLLRHLPGDASNSKTVMLPGDAASIPQSTTIPQTSTKILPLSITIIKKIVLVFNDTIISFVWTSKQCQAS